MTRADDFSLRALFEALDAQRQARGLSWAQVMRQMSGQSNMRSRSHGHALSASTVKATRIRTVSEADGILQMLLWLDRAPESFVPGHPHSEDASARLPSVPAGRVLRFETKKLHVALDAQRIERKTTWTQVAKEIGVGVSSLTHLARGGRTAFPQVMRIVRWLGRPAAHFTHASPR